jgi:hypothetical protein
MSRQAVRLNSELTQPDVASLSASVYQEWLPRRNRYATRENPAEFAGRVDAGLPVLQQLAKALHDRHALLLAGTDTPIFCLPGDCLHEEIRLLAASGIGNFDALRAATVNAGIFAARIEHLAPSCGTVAPDDSHPRCESRSTQKNCCPACDRRSVRTAYYGAGPEACVQAPKNNSDRSGNFECQCTDIRCA